MADALCGPSNALQNFQKHTTVDRTLQQDRLISRPAPTQGFRSTAGQSAGALDSEFDAFQAGRPADFHHPPPPQFAHPPPPQQQFVQPVQAPGWAADFQRLNISGSPVQQPQRQQPQVANAASAWHQDFMRQQTPVAQAPAIQPQPQYGGMSGYSMGGFAGNTFMQTPMYQQPAVSEVAQGKQRAQDAVPAFDEAAFEQAFLQAEAEAAQDLLAESEQQNAHAAQAVPAAMDYDRPGEMDPLLRRMRGTRPAVYSALQVWSEMGLGRTEEAVTYLDNMLRWEQQGKLIEDANEAKWIVDSLRQIINRDAPQEIKSRSESLIKAINERLMSQYPLDVNTPITNDPLWEEIEQAGYMRAPEPLQQKQPTQKEDIPQRNDDDEMAATAGQLLEKVADNTSEKFQNSQFLNLMRRLRDREVRVEEDKIVEVDAQASPAPAQSSNTTTTIPPQSHQSPSTQIPPVDPTILNHAATDFEMPIYTADDYTSQQQQAI